MKRLDVKRTLLSWWMLAIILPVTIAGAAIVYFSQAASPSGENMPTGNLNGWKLVFADDFLTDVPLGGFSGCSSSTRTCPGLPAEVRSKWWAYPEGWPDTSHNGTYSPSKTVSISGGVMNKHIYTDSTGKHLVAAVLPIIPQATGSKGGLMYGRYAIRFRSSSIPHYKTAWLLWPDSEVWPRDGEIDFPEGNLNSTIGAFLHYQNGTSGHDQVGFKTSATYTSWHTAVTEWTPTSVKFILDGQVIGSSSTRIPNTPMHWVVQSETNLDGVVPSASDQGNIQIDWAAAWAYSPGTVASTPSPTPTTPTPTPTTPTPSPATVGDLNADGKTNVLDLSILLSHWGTTQSGDLNKNGRVDVFDLSILLSHWTP